MNDEKPKTSIEQIDFILKDVYLKNLDEQLSRDILFYGSLPKPAPLTRKQKFVRAWKRFWNHIPDFLGYIQNYKYQDWQWHDDFCS